MRIKFKTMPKKLKFKRIIKKVLRNPPKGQEIREYPYKRLTSDETFALHVKLYAHDIGVLKKEKGHGLRCYLISEYEAAKRKLKEQEEERIREEIENRIDAKYFAEFLESNGVFLPEQDIKRTVQGYKPFYSRENDLYREYLGSQFSVKANKEYEEAICHTNA